MDQHFRRADLQEIPPLRRPIRQNPRRMEAVGFGLGVIATVDVRDGEGGLQSTVLTVTMAIP